MRLSDLLSDYHAKLIDTFRRRKQRASERRAEVTFTAAEVVQVLNDRFQVLLLILLDLERHEEVQQVQADRPYDPYQNDDFRGTRLDYFNHLYPEVDDSELADMVNEEHKVWLAGRANDTTLLPR